MKHLEVQANVLARKEFGYLESWTKYPDFTTNGELDPFCKLGLICLSEWYDWLELLNILLLGWAIQLLVLEFLEYLSLFPTTIIPIIMIRRDNDICAPSLWEAAQRIQGQAGRSLRTGEDFQSTIL